MLLRSQEAEQLQATLTALQDRVLNAIDHKKWTDLDEAWIEVLEEKPQPLAFHIPIIDRLIRKQDPSRFTNLYEQWLDATIEKGCGRESLDVIEFILGKYTQAEWLRPRLLQAAELEYAGAAGDLYEELLTRSGLANEQAAIVSSWQVLQDLVGATKGSVFRHNSWGLGVVRELDIDAGKVVIDFDSRPNQTMTLEGVRNFLKRIPPDHIMARMALDKEGLKAEIKSDPVAVVTLALRSFDKRMKVSDLKKLLTTRKFLEESEYKSFWAAARKGIKVDQYIDQTGTGVHAELILRDEARSFIDDVKNRLEKAETAGERLDVLRDVARHGDDADVSEADQNNLFIWFCQPLVNGKVTTEAERLEHGLLFAEYSGLFEGNDNPVPVDTSLATPEGLELVRGLTVHELRRQAYERIIALYPEEWPEIFADIAITNDTRTAAWMERIMREMDQDHYRQVAFERIIAKPDANPDLFVWAARNILEGRWKILAETLPKILIFEELLSLLSELQDIVDNEDEEEEKRNAARNQATKVRQVLNDRNARNFKLAANEASIEEARRILQDVRLHSGLSGAVKAQLEGILVNAHEELRRTGRQEEEEEKRKPSFHYTTGASLDRKRRELSVLLNDEIPAMATVIDQARQLGDLKENSEYHAAKDRQKLLMQQAAELEELIARARLVEGRDVTPDRSRFGTKVTVRDLAQDTVRTITLLGMWEANPDVDVISYLTPLGQQLLNKAVGEEFTVKGQDGTETPLRVEAIASAMEEHAGGSTGG